MPLDGLIKEGNMKIRDVFIGLYKVIAMLFLLSIHASIAVPMMCLGFIIGLIISSFKTGVAFGESIHEIFRDEAIFKKKA